MNKYQIDFISGEADPDSIGVFGETESAAIEWLRVDCQHIAAPFEILSTILLHQETKAERFDRYTVNLKKVNSDESHQFFKFVVEYWDRNDWKALFNVATGAYCFCLDEKVKSDIGEFASFSEYMLHSDS
jgi:hypothetical protein